MLMARSEALKHLSTLLLRGGTEAAAKAQQTAVPSACPQLVRSIATSSAAAADSVNATPAQPPAAAGAVPQQIASAGNSGGDGGGRSMGPVLLLPAAVAAGLGSWQLARRSEKQQQLDDRLTAMRVRAYWHRWCQRNLYTSIACVHRAEVLVRAGMPYSFATVLMINLCLVHSTSRHPACREPA